MPKKYLEIEGWFDKDFAKVYDILIEECKDGDIIVECGSWKGCSSCYLLEKAVEMNKKPKIYFFDSWADDEKSHLGQLGQRHPEFINNLKNAGFFEPNDFTTVITHAIEAPKIFTDKSVFAVMIDDNHAPVHVQEELRLWREKAKIITFHDYPDANLRPVFNALGNVQDMGSCGFWRNNV